MVKGDRKWGYIKDRLSAHLYADGDRAIALSRVLTRRGGKIGLRWDALSIIPRHAVAAPTAVVLK